MSSLGLWRAPHLPTALYGHDLIFSRSFASRIESQSAQ